jgi:hypothetical protein
MRVTESTIVEFNLKLSQEEFEFIYRLMYHHVGGLGHEREINSRLCDGMRPTIEARNLDEAPLFCNEGSDVVALRQD